MNLILKSYLSVFGAGFFPKIPGTIGSLVVLMLYLNGIALNWVELLIILSLGFLAGAIFFSQANFSNYESLDPSWVVIDEFCGQALVYNALNLNDPLNLGLGFILFRFFDIVKPWPISVIDSKVGLNSFAISFLIMADDILAAIMVIGVYKAGMLLL